MLKPPPPNRWCLDEEALGSEGRAKYLTTLERKLDRLQGSDKRSITSKDIMSSLSEARDDHMRQTQYDHQFTSDIMDHSDHNMTPPPRPRTHDDHTSQIQEPSTHHHSSVQHRLEPISTEDPWSVRSDSGVTDDQSKGEEEVPQYEYVMDVELERSCCGSCFRRRGHSSAPRIRQWTGGGGGFSTDGFREMGPRGHHDPWDTEGMKTTGDIRQASPENGTGQGLRAKSTGLSLRGIVGKLKRPEDDLTLDEEREFLLKCDELEEGNY